MAELGDLTMDLYTLLTPQQAKEKLIKIGFKEPMWNLVLHEGRKAPHATRALIRIARGQDAQMFEDVREQIRLEDKQKYGEGGSSST